ncbi:DNA topoisomerase III [Mycoplasmatota bacterium]|nr:DNA topoisomerase III [Mycoplasmatota bacterium]
MSKTLVLAEKPSVARDIGRVLKCHKKEYGFIEGNEYIVTWALGHLVTLANPEKYNMKFKSWRLEDLPIMPKELELEVIPKTSKQYSIVKKQMYRKDVHEIVIATDAGREGELVARWILEKANVRKKIKRLWISSVTDKAISDGFKQLKDGRLYENLYASAQSRAFADWYIGINATRALTTKYNAQLSCGRVQTPTLAIIAKREQEIRNFKPKDYYGITALSDQIKLTWHDKKTNDIKSFNKGLCDQLVNNLRNKKAVVTEVQKSFKKQYAPNLYDLTELQRDANRIYGFSAKETLSIMQSLYERHKALTYPRTDSKYLTTDIVGTLKDRIQAVKIGNYVSIAQNLLSKPIKSNRSFVDNTKVSDHHAIIPTEQRVSLSQLNDREFKIYDLVVKRFLAVLYPPFEYEQITIHTNIGSELFTAKGKRVISNGWKAIYQAIDEDESEDQVLPDINKGDTLNIKTLKQTSGQTKPPAPFTEGTLLKAMENPVKYMESSNKNLIKTIGETGGLGTVATRADIIEKLFRIFLIEKRGKDIYTTSKGKQLLELVPNKLKSPLLTAEWEDKLSKISKGNLNKNEYIHNMKDYAMAVVQEIKKSEQKFKHDNLTSKECPNCGKLLLEVKAKDAKLLVCQDRTCGYRKTISKLTNARCPICHKKLELYGEGDNQIFICGCGHKEKMSTFNERKKKEKNSLSKKDVSKYLNKINKENDVTVNSSLADALKNFQVKK